MITLIFFGYIIVSLIGFYALYLAVMSLYRSHLDGTMPLASKLLGYPILAVGIVYNFYTSMRPIKRFDHCD